MNARTTVPALALLVVAQAAVAQPVMKAKPGMATAVSALTLSSEFAHPANIEFAVTAGTAQTICSGVVLTVPTATSTASCGAVVPGSSLTVRVIGFTIDRCAGRTGNSLVACSGSYANPCPPGSTSRCRYYGGFTRVLAVTVPMVSAGQAVRLTLADGGTALRWR